MHAELDTRIDGIPWRNLSKGVTDPDGRIDLMPEDSRLVPGIYRITFDTRAYFRGRNVDTFYPSVIIMFEIKDPASHYHVPLLISPFGYSTYRGS
jgi:5-hydroxyisourate hydrolase